ncbi:hypothetical protein C7M84_006283, partial [Penaeus vannamei]
MNIPRVWQHKRGLDDESVAVLLENLPSDYGDTDTEDDTDDEAPGSRDLINNDPRVQEECCTIIIGGDETAPDADVGNPDMDGRPITSEDDQTSQRTLLFVSAVVLLAESSRALQDEGPAKGKFFLKSYSTTTFTMLSTFTTVVPFQCFFTSDGVEDCQGRKLRRLRKLSIDVDEVVDSSLTSSKGEIKGDVEQEADANPSERVFFTL